MKPIKCKECRLKTEVVRSIKANGMGMKTEYLCRKCNIAWGIDNNGNLEIMLSNTHKLASKLSDKEFGKMIKIVKKHTQSSEDDGGIFFTQKIRNIRGFFGF